MNTDINQWNKYYELERTPAQLAELRRHNEEQDALIQETRDMVRDVHNGLYGPDGQNGLRRELRNYQITTTRELTEMKKKIDSIVPSILKAIGGLVAALSGLAALITAVIHWMG